MMPKRRSLPAVPRKEFTRFVEIVRRLRNECPWDRKQTHRSLRDGLIEETYEVIDALDRRDMRELHNELGDLLLHIAMHATIAEESKEFSFDGVLRGICDKLIRRHPHVFGTTKVRGTAEVLKNWGRLKMEEGRKSVLEGVPRVMPSLERALKVQERASAVGFDWKNKSNVWAKVREEVEELRAALRSGSTVRREEEFGDLLFSLVNFSRHVGVNPERALHRSVERFTQRFQHVEHELENRGRDVHDATLKEMDSLWNEAKKRRLRKRPT